MKEIIPPCRQRGKGWPAPCCRAMAPPRRDSRRGAQGAKTLPGSRAEPRQPLVCACVSPPALQGRPSHGSYSRLTSTERSVSPSAGSALVFFPVEEKHWGKAGPAERSPRGLAFERSTRVLAWSLSFLCSIFTLRNLGGRKEQTQLLPPPQLQTAAGDLPASTGNGPRAPNRGLDHYSHEVGAQHPPPLPGAQPLTGEWLGGTSSDAS